MLRGIRIFRCGKCKKIFWGFDTEWHAMVLLAPLKCPKCGSMHTKPLFEGKGIYEVIWKDLDAKTQSRDNTNDWYVNYDLTMRLRGYHNGADYERGNSFPVRGCCFGWLVQADLQKTFTNEALQSGLSPLQWRGAAHQARRNKTTTKRHPPARG